MLKKLKHIISIFLSAVFVILMCVSVFAADDEQGNTAELKDIVNAQLSEEEVMFLKNLGVPHTVTNGKVEFEYPIIKCLKKVFDQSSGEPLESRIAFNDFKLSLSQYSKSRTYIVLDLTPYSIHSSSGLDDYDVTISYFTDIPTVITDILNLSENIIINGQECVLQGVYYFNGFNSNDGYFIYLQTDKGVFVKYYPYSSTEVIIFTEDEFRVVAFEFYKYSRIVSINEYGESIVKYADFNRFLNNPQKYDDPYVFEPKASALFIVACLIVCILLAAIIVPTVLLIIEKRKGGIVCPESKWYSIPLKAIVLLLLILATFTPLLIPTEGGGGISYGLDADISRWESNVFSYLTFDVIDWDNVDMKTINTKKLYELPRVKGKMLVVLGQVIIDDTPKELKMNVKYAVNSTGDPTHNLKSQLIDIDYISMIPWLLCLTLPYLIYALVFILPSFLPRKIKLPDRNAVCRYADLYRIIKFKKPNPDKDGEFIEGKKIAICGITVRDDCPDEVFLGFPTYKKSREMLEKDEGGEEGRENGVAGENTPLDSAGNMENEAESTSKKESE